MCAERYVGIVMAFDLAAMRDVMEGLDVPLKPQGNLGHGDFFTGFDGPLTAGLCGFNRWMPFIEAITSALHL